MNCKILKLHSLQSAPCECWCRTNKNAFPFLLFGTNLWQFILMLKTPIADMLGIHKQENLLPHTQYLITADHCSFPALLQSLSLIISKVYVSFTSVFVLFQALCWSCRAKIKSPNLACSVLFLLSPPLYWLTKCVRAFVEHANMNLLSGTEI